jgi:hypothetical protein
MQPRSALTAAFKSGGATEPSGRPQNALDAASFPCVSDASPASIGDLSAGLGRVDLQRTHLAGSAPTARTLPGHATVSSDGLDASHNRTERPALRNAAYMRQARLP